jgi:hypothetical protein
MEPFFFGENGSSTPAGKTLSGVSMVLANVLRSPADPSAGGSAWGTGFSAGLLSR